MDRSCVATTICNNLAAPATTSGQQSHNTLRAFASLRHSPEMVSLMDDLDADGGGTVSISEFAALWVGGAGSTTAMHVRGRGAGSLPLA